jgi:hypothetical protein
MNYQIGRKPSIAVVFPRFLPEVISSVLLCQSFFRQPNTKSLLSTSYVQSTVLDLVEGTDVTDSHPGLTFHLLEYVSRYSEDDYGKNCLCSLLAINIILILKHSVKYYPASNISTPLFLSSHNFGFFFFFYYSYVNNKI